MDELLFERIKVGARDKTQLRDQLRKTFLDRALNNEQFSKIFLGGNILQLADMMRPLIQRSLSDRGQETMESVARRITSELEKQIAPQRQQGRDRGERKMQK